MLWGTAGCPKDVFGSSRSSGQEWPHNPPLHQLHLKKKKKSSIIRGIKNSTKADSKAFGQADICVFGGKTCGISFSRSAPQFINQPAVRNEPQTSAFEEKLNSCTSLPLPAQTTISNKPRVAQHPSNLPKYHRFKPKKMQDP